MNFIKQKLFMPFRRLTYLPFLIIILTAIYPFSILAQPDTVYVQSDISPDEGNLNRAIETVSAMGLLSKTVFKLELYGRYVLIDSILVPAGEHLTIVAPEPGTIQETAPPQILATADSLGFGSTVNFMVYCLGSLTMKNLWLLYANTNGLQVDMSILFRENEEGIDGQKCEFENVIVDYSSMPTTYGGSITIASTSFKGLFKNCYWKNCSDRYYKYYGRAVSFPYGSSGWHIDNLIFENCTFANMGYVYGQWNGNYVDYIKFNHCTFLNTVMYALQSGWWYKMAVTNSFFVNTYMLGYIPYYDDVVDGYGVNGGTIRIDSISTFGFEVLFTEQNRRILFANNSYYIEKWLSDWMQNNFRSVELRESERYNVIPQPQPMLNSRTLSFFDATENGRKVFPYMNRAALYDSVNPNFIFPPSDTSNIKEFLLRKWFFGSTAHAWPWKPENSLNRLWPLEENLAFTNDTLLTAGMSGFPLGDLYRWFPDEYTQWDAQEETENARISHWLEAGTDSIFTDVKAPPTGAMPSGYKLSQNYPNPFNPSTIIKVEIPKNMQIKILIFDINGKLVKELFHGQLDIGAYQFTWNASNISSGIYFIKLESKDFNTVVKCMLLK